MERKYNSLVIVISKSSKGQVFFRRLFKRQQAILDGFSVIKVCPRLL